MPGRADGKPGTIAAPASTKAGSAERFATAVRPFLASYCVQCHGQAKPKAGLNLAQLEDESKARSSLRVWAKVKENVEGSLMPPEGKAQPSRQELEALSKWIDEVFRQTIAARRSIPAA